MINTTGTIILDRYSLESRICRGGQGEIFKGFDPILKNAVCIKVYNKDEAESYQIEKKVLSLRLSANIPNIINSGEWNSKNVIVMDYISGKNLREYLQNSPMGALLPLRSIIEIFSKILKITESLYNYKEQIIYGDYKPDNFIRTPEEQIYMIDFGASSFLNKTGHSQCRKLGTPGYTNTGISQKLSVRSDYYGLGCLLFFLITGDDPPVLMSNEVIDKNVKERYRCFKPILKSLISDYSISSGNIKNIRNMLSGLDFRTCSNCGAELTPGKHFCRRCGTPVEKDPSKITTTEKPDSGVSIIPSIILPNPRIKKVKTEKTQIFKKLQKREFSPSHWFDLRALAEEIHQVKSFEKLLCLPEADIEHYDFQLENVNTALNIMSGNVILADEVGLGKTIQGCLIVKELIKRGLAKRILIIVPPSLIYQWQGELLNRFNEKFTVYSSGTGWNHKKMIVSLYSARMRRNIRELADYFYDVVIVDEANCISRKNGDKGSLWDVVYNLRKKYLVLITATPFRNHLKELYNMATLVKPGQFLDYDSFRSRFIDPWDNTKAVNKRELKRSLGEVMIRNRRREAWGGAERKRNIFNYIIKRGMNCSQFYKRKMSIL